MNYANPLPKREIMQFTYTKVVSDEAMYHLVLKKSLRSQETSEERVNILVQSIFTNCEAFLI